jgi:hypothetical protein
VSDSAVHTLGISAPGGTEGPRTGHSTLLAVWANSARARDLRGRPSSPSQEEAPFRLLHFPLTALHAAHGPVKPPRLTWSAGSH